MEMTTTIIKSISSCPKLFQFHRPSLHFGAPVPTSLRFPFVSQRNRTLTFSLADDTTSTSKVAVKDPSLAIKKKAMDMLPDLKGSSIFLVGMNNSIKTSLGKLLADALRYYYFDSDSLVLEAAGGESAAKSFRESDEKGYQEAETEVLKQLSSMGRLVVCAGNGAVQSSTNLALLRHGISIWIDVPLDIVAQGLIEDQSELAASEVLPEIAALYQEMRGGYATADATVSLQKVANQLGHDGLDAVSMEDLTVEVLKEIEKLIRVKKMMEDAARPF